MSSSHSVDCANAVVTSPDQCKCQCNGAFHGGPNTNRARALLREQGQKKYSKNQVSASLRKARKTANSTAVASQKMRVYTDYIGFSTVDGLIRFGSLHDQRETIGFISTVVRPFTAEINASALTAQQKNQVKDFVLQGHIVCTLCVTVLKIISDGSDDAYNLSDEVIGVVLNRIGIDSDSQDAVDVAIRAAIGASASAIVGSDLVTSGVAFLKLIGVITCPDMNEHPEVIEYCLTPLCNTWTDSTVTQWLRSNPQDLSKLIESVEGA